MSIPCCTTDFYPKDTKVHKQVLESLIFTTILRTLTTNSKTLCFSIYNFFSPRSASLPNSYFSSYFLLFSHYLLLSLPLSLSLSALFSLCLSPFILKSLSLCFAFSVSLSISLHISLKFSIYLYFNIYFYLLSL